MEKHKGIVECLGNAADETSEHQGTRRRLLEAALAAFMEQGYQASTENVAYRAGLSRQTLYNHFSSKQELFAAVANEASRAILATLKDTEGDIHSRLLRFSQQFRELVNGDIGLKLFRALIAEAPRMPELAQAFFANGPEKGLTALSEMLAEAMARGELRSDDPRFAAEMLFGMLTGVDRSRRLCGTPARMAQDEQEYVLRIVNLFVRAYLPDGSEK